MLPRLLLLLSAYSPLPLLIGIRDHDSNQMWVLIALAVVLALALPAVYLVKAQTTNPAQLTIGLISSDPDEIAGYLMSYILPFVTLSSPTARDLIALAVFAVFLIGAYLQSGRVPVNPWLLLARVRPWRVNSGADTCLLLSRTEPAPGDVYDAVRIVRGLYYGRRT